MNSLQENRCQGNAVGECMCDSLFVVCVFCLCVTTDQCGWPKPFALAGDCSGRGEGQDPCKGKRATACRGRSSATTWNGICQKGSQLSQSNVSPSPFLLSLSLSLLRETLFADTFFVARSIVCCWSLLLASRRSHRLFLLCVCVSLSACRLP